MIWWPFGLLVLAVLAWDVLRTVLEPSSGAGPLTARIGGLLWRFGHVGDPSPTSWRLRAMGPAVLATTIGVWALLLVYGWWLVVMSVEPVVATATEVTASRGERLYFVVTTIATLGPGDFVATGQWGRIATALAAVSGLGLFTLAVTYVLPIVTAVTQRRTQAAAISALGTTPGEIATALDDPQAASTFLDEMGAAIRALAQQHLAYPILHFFHSGERHAGFAPSVAALDEAVGLLAARPAADRPAMLTLRRFRSAVDDLLDVTSHHLGQHLPADPPPAPPPEGGSQQGAAVRCRHDHDEHRRHLEALVIDDGWRWQQHVQDR